MVVGINKEKYRSLGSQPSIIQGIPKSKYNGLKKRDTNGRERERNLSNSEWNKENEHSNSLLEKVWVESEWGTKQG